jgi:hypothetical protein
MSVADTWSLGASTTTDPSRSASTRSAAESYFKMALKAQNQCRMTLETLSNIKNPPVVYAKQANIANGPQQVNNGPTRAREANQNCADQSIGAKP